MSLGKKKQMNNRSDDETSLETSHITAGETRGKRQGAFV